MPVRLPLNTLRNPLKTLRAHTQTSSMRTPTFNAHFQRNSRSPSKTRCMHKKSRKRPTCPRNSLNVRMKPKSEKSDHSIKSAADDGCISHTCAELQAPQNLAQANHLHRTLYPKQDTLTYDTLAQNTLAQNTCHVGHMTQNTWNIKHMDTWHITSNILDTWHRTWYTCWTHVYRF